MERKLTMAEEKKLLVVTASRSVGSTMRGKRGQDEAETVIEEGIPLDKLQSGFANFMDGLSEIVQAGYDKVGSYQLDEISFSAEIGAQGEFKLLGSGVGVSGKAGVSFKLRRAATTVGDSQSKPTG
jgi:hypothetical protein